MKKEKLFNQIEQYLEGSLQGAEAKAFEESLQKDTELAAEVELHRKLENALGDSQKLELRQKLNTIGENFNQNQSGATVRSLNSRYNLLLVAAGVALAIGLIYWLMENGDPVNPSNDSILTEDQIEPNEELPEIQLPPQEEIAEDVPQDNNNEQPEVNPTPSTPKNQLADAFAPNPALEAIMGNADQSKSFEFELDVQDQKSADGQVQFKLEGLAEAADFEEGDKLQLDFFNNDNQSIVNSNLNVSLSDEEPTIAFGRKFNFFDLKYKANLDLKPGVYYYVIKKENSDEPLYVGKITVE